MTRTGDIRDAFQVVSTKRRRVEPLVTDNITATTPKSSGNNVKCDKSRRSLRIQDDQLEDGNHSIAVTSPAPQPCILAKAPNRDDDFLGLGVPKQAPLPSESLNLTFQSTSSLSAVPPSSQPSIVSTRSQRICRDGEQLVTNSSSEADDLKGDDESQEDLLLDQDEDDEIEMMIAKKRQSIAAEKEVEQSTTRDDTPTLQHNMHSSGSVFEKQPRVKHPSVYPTPPKPFTRNPLGDILKQKRKKEALEARLKELKAQDQRGDERFKAFQALDDDDEELARQAAAALDGEKDADFRLKIALKRMDALEHEVKFYFFDTVPESDPTRLPFPAVAQTWDKWMFTLHDNAFRAQSALSGFLTDLCHSAPLPSELQEWLLGEILFEDRDDLSEAYVNILSACSMHNPGVELIDVPMLKDSFARLGAKDQIVYEGNDEDEHNDSQAPNFTRRPAKTGRRGLSSFLLLLSKLSKRLGSRTLELALYFCALVLVDDHKAASVVITVRTQQTLCDLLESVDAATLHNDIAIALTKRLFTRLSHPVLVARLLSRLPSTLVRMALLRRQLAYAWITRGALPDLDALTRHSTWATVNSVVASPAFRVIGTTDYSTLAAQVFIVDVVVGSGFSDLSFLASCSSSSFSFSTGVARSILEKQKEERKDCPLYFFDKRRTAAPPISEEERAFDAEVDRLVASLRRMASLIRESGAAHVRRTECKGAIERLVVRLESTVRTRPRIKQGVFHASSGKSFA